MKAKSKTKPQPRPVLTIDLRETLKNILRNEIDRMPAFLETLEPKERMNLIVKMMPFIFPKVEAVEPTLGEPFQINL